MGVAAAAAAAAGAYFFYGSANAASNRKTARSWMLKARAEVMAAVEKAAAKTGALNKETYTNIVNGVLARYSKVAGATSAEMSQVSRDMEGAWKHMQKAGKKGVKKVKKVVKNVTQ